MKSMKYLNFILLVLLFAPYWLIAQASQGVDNNNQKGIIALSKPLHDTVIIRHESSEEFLIDELLNPQLVYLFEKPLKAIFHYPNQILESDLNYNMLYEVIIRPDANDNYNMLVLSHQPDSICIEGRTFFLHNDKVLLERISTAGNIAFFIKYKTNHRLRAYNSFTKLTQKYPTGSVSIIYYDVDSEAATFLTAVSRPYLCYFKGRRLIDVRRERQLLSIVERKHRSSLKEYVQTNDLSIDNIDDIMKIVNYVNTIE